MKNALKNDKEERLVRVEDAFNYISNQLKIMDKKLDVLSSQLTKHSEFISAQNVYNKIYWFLFVTFFSALIGILIRIGFKL